MRTDEDRILYRIAETMPTCCGIDRDDYVSVGRMALISARQHYDASRGVAYSTYAWKCARNAMLRLFRQEARYRALSGTPPLFVGTYQPEDDFAYLVCGLAPTARSVITLRYALMYTQRETAAIVGLSQSTVYRIEQDALANIRVALQV